ncbi:hypothetical protein [Paenibacillus agricola]|uniref:Uncharacterized protein n=1 Tax=Paenibacillus agricola TaxID=2716264 RepID=A0ABX0JC52_9BACL|nr:hypothetical protein [Paenibacillus agricola]NHN33351.1 hypothetical protein [Paenibacillus agricola]
MSFTFKMILYLLITTFMMVAIILDHADNKNVMYIEMEASEAILKAPPAGYITSALQQQIKDNLVQTRGLVSSDIQITGDVSVTQRKVRGSAAEDITLIISYPRRLYIFFGDIVTNDSKAFRRIKTEYAP